MATHGFVLVNVMEEQTCVRKGNGKQEKGRQQCLSFRKKGTQRRCGKGSTNERRSGMATALHTSGSQEARPYLK